jgi:hypothetical protein
MKIIAILCLACTCLSLLGCKAQSRVYKVTYENGDTDYFELNYKPKASDNFIEYNGETILGINKIELIE